LAFTLPLPSAFSAELKKPESIDEHATHQQVATIKLQVEDDKLKINAFTLNKAGQIVAACGAGPGQIRIADDEGKILQSWETEVKPEAVNVGADGSILVGGEGKLFRFDAAGKLLQQADSPHAAALREGTEAIREEAIAYLNRKTNTNSLQSRITTYQRIIDQLTAKAEKDELNESEKRMLELLPKTLERYTKQAEEEAAAKLAKGEKEEEPKGPTEKEIESQVASLIKSKMKISSISSNADNVFVATRGIKGYGYVVWKMTNEFSAGEVIVEGLSGCCGQMDVQCCPNGLFVAENSRHRVVRYDDKGEEITKWGKQDRTGVEGFSSCCNPMNVCFNATNEVFTAESGTGRIKRYDADGKFVAYVGDVDLVPGCKNVSIAVSPDSDRVYMLDLTRNHIVMMQTRSEKAEPKEVADASK